MEIKAWWLTKLLAERYVEQGAKVQYWRVVVFQKPCPPGGVGDTEYLALCGAPDSPGSIVMNIRDLVPRFKNLPLELQSVCDTAPCAILVVDGGTIMNGGDAGSICASKEVKRALRRLFGFCNV